MKLVLDACALIAYLGNEPGGEVVDQLLSDPGITCLVHSINLCEVFYNLRRPFGEEAAFANLQALVAAGVIVRDDMDEALWLEAGRIKADYRRISLADCFCVALATREAAEIVTTDHQEFDPLVQRGACAVRFIR